MEEVTKFKFLGTVQCKCGSTEEEVRERAVQGRQVTGTLGSHGRMKCEPGSREVYEKQHPLPICHMHQT